MSVLDVVEKLVGSPDGIYNVMSNRVVRIGFDDVPFIETENFTTHEYNKFIPLDLEFDKCDEFSCEGNKFHYRTQLVYGGDGYYYMFASDENCNTWLMDAMSYHCVKVDGYQSAIHGALLKLAEYAQAPGLWRNFSSDMKAVADVAQTLEEFTEGTMRTWVTGRVDDWVGYITYDVRDGGTSLNYAIYAQKGDKKVMSDVRTPELNEAKAALAELLVDCVMKNV